MTKEEEEEEEVRIKYKELGELKTDKFGETIAETKKMVINSFTNTKECKLAEVACTFITDSGCSATIKMGSKNYDKEYWEASD